MTSKRLSCSAPSGLWPSPPSLPSLFLMLTCIHLYCIIIIILYHHIIMAISPPPSLVLMLTCVHLYCIIMDIIINIFIILIIIILYCHISHKIFLFAKVLHIFVPFFHIFCPVSFAKSQMFVHFLCQIFCHLSL